MLNIVNGTNKYGEPRFNFEDKGHVIGWAERQRVYHGETFSCYVQKEYIGSADTLIEAKQLISECYHRQGLDKTLPAQMEAKAQRKLERRFPAALLPSNTDAEFYPTPQAIAGKMLRLVDAKRVRYVLEPSAGKGDLAHAVVQFMNNPNLSTRRGDFEKKSVDCIEIDQNLQHILYAEGYSVVHDDFLTYNPLKRYDLIIMNPPFSNGDKHLLHAIGLMEKGGQILCILNAETIRNPYTVSRQLLQKKLAELNARIEFVQDAFKKAERKSDVEIAVVYIDIPKPLQTSFFFEKMKKTEEATRGCTAGQEPKAIVSSDWMERLVAAFNLEGKAGIEFIEEWNGLRPYIMADSSEYARPLLQLKIAGRDVDKVSGHTIEDYLRTLRSKYWKMLLYQPELTRKMTSNILDDFRSKVDELSNYEFSVFNIRRVLREMTGQLGESVEATILELFDKLSCEFSWFKDGSANVHYYNGWATNKAHKVAMKVIIPANGMFAESYSSCYLKDYRICSMISDLEKTLQYLDCGETTMLWDIGSVVKFADENMCAKNMHFTYFDATFYKKGTCHIKFHDSAAKIIERLNIFAARKRGWLPPNYGKVRYENMSREEQVVIDEFQGKQGYDAVMADPGKYILNPAGNCALLGASA